MELPPSLRALRSPNYRRYFLGQMVSMLGTWIQSIALMWLAYRLSGSTAFTGLVGFLNGIPYLVISPLAGVLGDRMPRRKILITVHCLLLTQAAALAVLTGLGLITMPVLAGLALFAGLCNAFETPTRQSLVVQLLEKREDLPNAIALNSILMNAARLAGPSIGGILIAAFGETVCFTVNAFTYLIVIAALLGTRIVHRRPTREASHPLADLAEGFRYAMGTPAIRRMLFTLGAVSFSIGPYTTLMPAIAVKTFGQGSELVGLFIGCVGLGAIIAATGLARRESVRGLAIWIGVAAMISGVGAAGFCFSRHVWLSALLMVMTGYGMFLSGSSCNTILQTVVDEDKRGRVMSYFVMFFIGAVPLGHLTAGWLAEHIGAPYTFLAGGLLAMVTGAIFTLRIGSFRAHLRPAYERRGIIPTSPESPPGS